MKGNFWIIQCRLSLLSHKSDKNLLALICCVETHSSTADANPFSGRNASKWGRWVGTVGTGIKGGTCQLWCQSVNGAAIAIGRETALVTKCVLAVHWLEGDLSRTFPLFNGDAVLTCCSYRITWAEKLMLLLGKAGKHPGNVSRCSVCFVLS